jgi:hypothetical protein
MTSLTRPAAHGRIAPRPIRVASTPSPGTPVA